MEEEVRDKIIWKELCKDEDFDLTLEILTDILLYNACKGLGSDEQTEDSKRCMII